MSKKIIIFIIIVVICIHCVGNCLANELNILLNSSIINLDPTTVMDQSSLTISRHLNCQLFRHKNGYEIVPEAAKSVNISNNGKSIEITLREDLHFTDGTPLTSRDVKDTFEYVMLKRPSFRNVLMWIDKIEIISPQKLNIILKRSVPMLFRAFAGPNFAIFKSSFIKGIRTGAEDWINEVGCGEYKIENWKPYKYVQLVPANNKNYPKLNFFLSNAENRFENNIGKYDIVALYYPPSESYGYKKSGFYDPYILFLAINTKLNKWRNREERCTAFNSINSGIILTAYSDKRNISAVEDIVPAGVLGYDDLNSYRGFLNPNISKKYKKLKIMIRSVAVPEQNWKSIEDAFRELSNDVELVVLESGAKFADDFRTSGSDFFITGLKGAYGEAYEFLQIFTDNRINPTGYEEPKLITAINESQFIVDSRERAKAYQNISREIKKQCLILPILQMTNRYVLIKKGIDLPGLGETVFNEYFLGDVLYEKQK